MENLTAALGGPSLYIKRDDCTGLATGAIPIYAISVQNPQGHVFQGRKHRFRAYWWVGRPVRIRHPIG